MLQFFRNKMKLFLLIILVGIIPAFALWGVSSLFKTPTRKIMGEINGKKIGTQEYQKAQLAILWDALLSNKTLDPDDVNEGTWNRLILLDEAKKYEITVSDEEVAKRITQIFQRGGRFDRNFYMDVLQRNRISPQMYEQTTRDSLKIERLRDIILEGVKLTDMELINSYKRENDRLTLEYVMFESKDFQDKITPSDTEIQEYFETNKDNYRKPAEVNANYIEVAIADQMPSVNVTDNDGKEYFEDNQDEFKQEHKVKARHILFKMPENADESVIESVQTRANEVLEKAKAGEDFAELAKTYSEGPSAPQGGDLGLFGKGAMVPPFEEAAFSLKTGEIYDGLVKTRFGYHIIKVEEVQEESIPDFNDIKEEVMEKLKISRADAYARELIEECYYKSDDREAMVKFAEDLGLEIKETGFFSNPYNIPNIGNSPDFHKQAFDLELFNVGEIVKTDLAYYILSPIDKQSGILPELSEIKDRVERDYKRENAKEQAQIEADKLAEQIKKSVLIEKISFKDAVEKTGFSVETTNPFTISSPDPSLGFISELGNKLFTLKADEISIPIKTSKGVFIAHALHYQEIDLETLDEAKKEKLREEMGFQKKYLIFQEWIDNIKQNAKLVDLTKYVNQNQ